MSVGLASKSASKSNQKLCNTVLTLDALYMALIFFLGKLYILHLMSIISRESENTTETKVFKKHYSFLTGRHSGSFFLKIGAAIFCMGKIIHNCIMLARNLIGYFDDNGEQSLFFL